MFKKAKVLYYLSSGKKLSKQKILNLISDVTNSSENISFDFLNFGEFEDNFYNNLIPGTIIAESLSEKLPGESSDIFLCYPFYSLHFSSPLKPGEVVWFFEDEESKAEKSNDVLHVKVNKYWLSRVCGSLISEDVNYSDYERNFLILNSETNKKNAVYTGQTLPEKNMDNLKRLFLENTYYNPSYEKSSFFNALNPGIAETSKIYNKFRYKDFYPDAIPRYFSKPHEMTLQGSNNTLLNLTSRNEGKGAIDLIAGRLALEEYISDELEESNIFKLSSLESVNYNQASSDIVLDRSFHKIQNTSGDLELFKSVNTYIGQDIEINIDKESQSIYEYDASILSVSENNDFLESSYNLICDNTFKTYAVDSSTLFKADNIAKDFKVSDIHDFNRQLNNQYDILDSDVSSKPSILLKSNDIYLVARQELKTDNDTISAGSIMLAKEDETFLKESFVKINKHGDVGIDGKTIYIGNFLKEVVKKNLMSEDEVLFSSEENPVDTLDKEALDSMHGTGEGVVLGYDQNLSEPLVLGNSLNVILKDMIELNITLIDEVDKLSQSLQTHIHVGIPGSGVSGPMQDPSAFITYSNQAKNSMNSSLDEIRNNLKFILSRFSKTS